MTHSPADAPATARLATQAEIDELMSDEGGQPGGAIVICLLLGLALAAGLIGWWVSAMVTALVGAVL